MKNFTDLKMEYLSSCGEGDNMMTQLITAVNKLEYKWWNDGDVFDTTGGLTGWANNISSYANWIYTHVADEALKASMLEVKESSFTGGDYDDLITELIQFCELKVDAKKLAASASVGSVYDCAGPFEFLDCTHEDEWFD